VIERLDLGLVYACLTHVPLWLEFPPHVTTIHLGQSQRDGRLNLRDLAPEWEPHHPVLGGTAGAFALRQYVLRHCPDATRVGICQYRKFVSRERISARPDLRYRSMDLVDRQQLPPDVFARALDPGDRQWLIGRPLSWGQHWKRSRRMTYLDQYARDHHVEDLLRFAAAAVEVGALDKAEVGPFLEEDSFVPGGIELGVFPAPFWLSGIEALEAAVGVCVRNHPAPRSGPQARSWAFCAERLGSYFILRQHGVVGSRRLRFRRLAQVFPPEWVRRCTGQLNLITEPGTNAYIPGT
jgi:hypothetical protein